MFNSKVKPAILNKRSTRGNIIVLFYLLHNRLSNSELPYCSPIPIYLNVKNILPV